MVETSLLLASVLGFYLLLLCGFGKRTALYPAIITSSIIVIGFFAGLLNCLQLIYSFIFVLGFVLVPLCMWDLIHNQKLRKDRIFQDFFPFVAFGIGVIWLRSALNDYFLYSYDDFSHWGRIARVLTSHFRFPIESDLLTHASYPPGSALFIAYVSNVCGSSDGVWLFAQSVLMLSFWLTLLLASKNALLQLVLSALIIPLMNYNTPMRSLMVDNLLASAAFAGIVTCLNNEERGFKGYIATAMILCATALIKNSGLFLSLLIAFYAVWLFWHDARTLSVKLLLLFLPIALQFLWNGYIDAHFTQEIKHQMTLDSYVAMLDSKSDEDLLTIWNIIFPIIVNPGRNRALCLMPVYLLLLPVYSHHRSLKIRRHIAVYAVFMFLVYETGMLLMYLFSMPMNEVIAQNGADFTRYNNTITAVLAALQLYQIPSFVLKRYRKNIRLIFSSTAAVVGFATVCFILSSDAATLRSTEYQMTKYRMAYQFACIKEKLALVPANSSYVVLFDGDEPGSGYYRGLSQYYLRSEEILRYTNPAEAREKMVNEKWRYYIDLPAGKIYEPTETVGKLLYTRSSIGTCSNILDVVGYQENTRYSVSAAEDVVAYHWDISGYINAKAGDTIHLQNVAFYPSEENQGRVGIVRFTADKEYISNSNFKKTEDLLAWDPVYDEEGNVVRLTVPRKVGSSVAYLRIVCQDINNLSVIKVNETDE